MVRRSTAKIGSLENFRLSGIMYQEPVSIEGHNIIIIESVDSISRDGPDVTYT